MGSKCKSPVGIMCDDLIKEQRFSQFWAIELFYLVKRIFWKFNSPLFFHF